MSINVVCWTCIPDLAVGHWKFDVYALYKLTLTLTLTLGSWVMTSLGHMGRWSACCDSQKIQGVLTDVFNFRFTYVTHVTKQLQAFISSVYAKSYLKLSLCCCMNHAAWMAVMQISVYNRFNYESRVVCSGLRVTFQIGHCARFSTDDWLCAWLWSLTGVSACEHGYYGVGCRQRCRCDDDVSCNAETGACACPAGRTGPHCQQRMYHNAVTRNLHPGYCSLISSVHFLPFISSPLLPLTFSFPAAKWSFKPN